MSDELYPQYPLRFVTGDTVKKFLTIEDPDPNSPDPDNPVMIPRDLTGYSGRAHIRTKAKDIEPIAVFLVTGFGTDGQINLHLTPEESAKVLRPAHWDLELTEPNGDVDTVLGGPVAPQEDYTK